jgi:hypothetical protein
MKTSGGRLKDRVVDVVNEMISLCEQFTIEEFNFKIEAKDVNAIRLAEKYDPKLGIANINKHNEGISTLSIMATITDILIDDRLAFEVDDDGFVVGVCWYNDTVKGNYHEKPSRNYC